MIDCENFKKIYEKMYISENHNLVIEKLSQVTGADGNRVQKKANELGYKDLSNIGPDDFNKIVEALMTDDKDQKEPIKDEDNLGDEQDELNEQDPNTDAEETPVDTKLLYDVIYAYYMATSKDDKDSREFINSINASPYIKNLERKYSTITKKSDLIKQQDEKNATNLPLFKSILMKLSTALTDDKKSTNNP